MTELDPIHEAHRQLWREKISAMIARVAVKEEKIEEAVDERRIMQ